MSDTSAFLSVLMFSSLVWSHYLYAHFKEKARPVGVVLDLISLVALVWLFCVTPFLIAIGDLFLVLIAFGFIVVIHGIIFPEIKKELDEEESEK